MIYCFSGTGNTRHVAELLSSRLLMRVHEFTPGELRVPEEAVLSSDDKVIIWAFPTYSWGVPPVVSRIIRKAQLNFPEDATHIAVTTCGDDVGNLSSMFRKLLKYRKKNVGAVFSVQMPNTYVMMKGFDTDAENIARDKIQAAVNKVDDIARAIESGKVLVADSDVVRGKFGWIKTQIIYPYFVRFEMSPRGFNVNTDKCISCGRCVKSCPMRNIALDVDRHPQWGSQCAFCTACYHVCPTHAVGWKKTTASKGQARYFNK